jgi:hypothetical protein
MSYVFNAIKKLMKEFYGSSEISSIPPKDFTVKVSLKRLEKKAEFNLIASESVPCFCAVRTRNLRLDGKCVRLDGGNPRRKSKLISEPLQ